MCQWVSCFFLIEIVSWYTNQWLLRLKSRAISGNLWAILRLQVASTFGDTNECAKYTPREGLAQYYSVACLPRFSRAYWTWAFVSRRNYGLTHSLYEWSFQHRVSYIYLTDERNKYRYTQVMNFKDHRYVLNIITSFKRQSAHAGQPISTLNF